MEGCSLLCGSDLGRQWGRRDPPYTEVSLASPLRLPELGGNVKVLEQWLASARREDSGGAWGGGRGPC